MTLTLLWLQLAAAAGIILVTAHFMAGAADIIAEKTGLGRSFVGVVLLATATSLPELGTGVSSIVLVGEVDLAAGDAFGSNLFNLLIIGLLDLYWRRGPILSSVTATSALIGMLGIVVISIALVAMLVHGLTGSVSGWYISPFSFAIFGAFLVSMFLIYRAENLERALAVPNGKGRELRRKEPDSRVHHLFCNGCYSSGFRRLACEYWRWPCARYGMGGEFRRYPIPGAQYVTAGACRVVRRSQAWSARVGDYKRPGKQPFQYGIRAVP